MSNRPSMSALLSGQTGSQGMEGLLASASELVKSHADGQKLRNAGDLITAATGGGSQNMDPVQTAVQALKVGAELGASQEVRAQEAQAAQAQAGVEMVRARNEHEVSVAGLLADILHKSNGGNGGNGGGLSIGDVLQLMNIANQNNNQKQGIDLAGVAAVITAALPLLQGMMNRGGDQETITTELRHQMDRLSDKLENLAKLSGKKRERLLSRLSEALGMKES